MGNTCAIWELPIIRRPQGPAVTHFYHSLSQKMDPLVLQLEIGPRDALD